MVMETRSAERNVMNEGLKKDRISDLPDDLLRHILCFLPIEAAARTVVLSRQWEKVFSSIPDLDFTCIASLGNKDQIIQNVLSRRDKNSSIRTLKMESQLSSMTLDSLIGYARGTPIQELDVKVSIARWIASAINNNIDIPLNMTLINCDCLKVLRLDNMHLSFNPTQSLVMNPQFKSLHTMTLSNILSEFHLHMFTDAMFPHLKKLRLVSCHNLTGLNFKCTNLEDLVIKKCSELNQLDIHGLKLERLKVHTCFLIRDSNIKIMAPVIKYLKWVGNDIIYVPILEKFPSLVDQVAFGFKISRNDQILGPKQRGGLSKMLLSKVKTLKFHHPSLESLPRWEDSDRSSCNLGERASTVRLNAQLKFATSPAPS